MGTGERVGNELGLLSRKWVIDHKRPALRTREPKANGPSIPLSPILCPNATTHSFVPIPSVLCADAGLPKRIDNVVDGGR